MSKDANAFQKFSDIHEAAPYWHQITQKNLDRVNAVLAAQKGSK